MPHPTHPEGVPLGVWLFDQDEPPSDGVIRRHRVARLEGAQTAHPLAGG